MSRRIRRKLLTSILCSYCNRRFSVTTVRFATTAPAKAMLPIVAKPPSFLERLRAILDAPSNEHVIRWADNGLQFEVRQPKLMHEILPNYFKHSNFSSFQRQLNYFGFHKVAPCGEGVCYAHQYFQRHKPQLMSLITRKTNRAYHAQCRVAQVGGGVVNADNAWANAAGGLPMPPAVPTRTQPTRRSKRGRIPSYSAQPAGEYVTAGMLESDGYRASFGDSNCSGGGRHRGSNAPPSSSAFPGSYSALAGVVISPIPFRAARPFPHSPTAGDEPVSSPATKRQCTAAGGLGYLSSNVNVRPRYSAGAAPGAGANARTSEPQAPMPAPMPAPTMPAPMPAQMPVPNAGSTVGTSTAAVPKPEAGPESVTPEAQLTRSDARPALHLTARPVPVPGHGHGHGSVRSRFDSDPLLRPLSPITPAEMKRTIHQGPTGPIVGNAVAVRKDPTPHTPKPEASTYKPVTVTVLRA